MSGDTNEYSFDKAARSLDVRLFGYVPTETSHPDQLSLLALYNACHDTWGPFAYLEIGSYLGGSLQVLLADRRCTAITSVDSRPLASPAEDLEPIPYPENSTARMLKYLEFVPGGDLGKLRTIEASTDEISVDQITDTPKLCLIDAEHTVEAALRDARFCRAAVRDEGIIAFHDRHMVRPAIDTLLAELAAEGVPHEGFPLPNAIYVVTLGEAKLHHSIEQMLAPRLERVARRMRERAAAGPGQ